MYYLWMGEIYGSTSTPSTSSKYMKMKWNHQDLPSKGNCQASLRMEYLIKDNKTTTYTSFFYRLISSCQLLILHMLIKSQFVFKFFCLELTNLCLYYIACPPPWLFPALYFGCLPLLPWDTINVWGSFALHSKIWRLL